MTTTSMVALCRVCEKPRREVPDGLCDSCQPALRGLMRLLSHEAGRALVRRELLAAEGEGDVAAGQWVDVRHDSRGLCLVWGPGDDVRPVAESRRDVVRLVAVLQEQMSNLPEEATGPIALATRDGRVGVVYGDGSPFGLAAAARNDPIAVVPLLARNRREATQLIQALAGELDRLPETS